MELLNADELATLLQVSRNKVIIMAKNGEIPAYMLLGKLRFDADEIAAWLKKLRLKPGDPVRLET
jgi:excisionase family DNA binding protein